MAEQSINGKTIHRLIKDDGTFPNNGRLPLLAYQGVLELPTGDPARGVEELFGTHNWGDSWRNGIFSYHHYHSTAHEVLGVYSGNANERPRADRNIAKVALPKLDPVFGEAGPLMQLWHS